MDNDTNSVGYKKPPKHSQFKPGQSGNPKGRPKGTKNLATDLEEELKEIILVTEGGKQRETTKQRAMVKSLFAKALKGDVRAIGVLLKQIADLEQSASTRTEPGTLSEDDNAILNDFRAQLLEELKHSSKKEKT
jgi:hypothetical protein